MTDFIDPKSKLTRGTFLLSVFVAMLKCFGKTVDIIRVYIS